MTHRILEDGKLYKVVGTMPTEQGAAMMAEAYARQTGIVAGYSQDRDNLGTFNVTVEDPDQTIDVTCNLCKCKYALNIKTAVKMTKNNEGYIPCEKCGSHATQWSLDR